MAVMNSSITPGGDSDGAPPPDSRWSYFPREGDSTLLTFGKLWKLTQAWPVTKATPQDPAARLKKARQLFASAYYFYELLVDAGMQSVFAVETALKVRLGREASKTPSKRSLIGPYAKAP